MPGRYDHLSRDDLIRLLERRDTRQLYGLVWEREGIEPDRAYNDDFVVLDLDPALSTAPQDARGWRNLVIEGDNWDALRALRLAYAGRVGCIVTHILLDALVRNVTFTPEHLGWVRQQRVEVERRETDLFDAAKQRRTEEQAAISDLFARENALRSLRVSDYIDPGVLAHRLRDRLGAAIAAAGEDVPDLRKLGRGLNLILVRAPGLCRAALRRAMAAHTEVVDAADLPRTWDSAVPLLESSLNLYGRIPGGLNTWEQAFVRWLDRQEGRVIWWLRNPARPNAADDWGVRIVLPEDGSGFYPDFVICVDGRKTRERIALADTKERIDDLPAEAKSRTQHREYGRALILTYDSARDRFTRIEFDPSLGRNKEIAPLRPDDLVSE